MSASREDGGTLVCSKARSMTSSTASVSLNVAIPESQHAKSSCFNLAIPARILVLLLLVLAAVQFDNELRLQASEIGDVGADRDLPAKSKPTELTPPQKAPQMTLGVGDLMSQPACSLLCNGIAHTCEASCIAPSPTLPHALRACSEPRQRQRIRLNHSSESKAARTASAAAAPVKSAVISVSFFSRTSRVLSVS